MIAVHECGETETQKIIPWNLTVGRVTKWKYFYDYGHKFR